MSLKMNGFWSTALLVGLAAGLSAQQPAPPKPAATPPAQTQEKPTFRVQVDLVTNDVIVRDDKGNFVPDLKKDDFEIIEDGVKQDISSMTVVTGGRVTNVLAPPPPPPPEVPDLDKPGNGKVLTGTLRQRMEQHREDPNCATCHARMDPIGFGLENFDGIGAWREQDGGADINPAGDLVSGEKFSGPADLRRILLHKKSGDFVRCISEKMLTYALGRGLEYYDKCAIEQISKNVTAKGYKFSVLVGEIARSVPFQMRRGEGDTASVAAK
jgi:hypothetical protein